ncbi:sugar phosphate isomerase/epimerase family protein [Paenibacillus paeoniae]|uniref:Sugar phosphate isomerase/epimerase n=1 Tax=Paenibacillus paeoniae TaxID=2292705 RepID=A0A371P6H5_9BACL|nr:sugar phosphate isomerase/epimerase family protein [Paenibacillus paeoniae]REK71138.1 sugar phosphate isomerase/epimerase [Paenibacillus paeoniae]
MKYSLCSISFRHQLISFPALVTFMIRKGFEGIELWGIHAKSLYEHERKETAEQLRAMEDAGLAVSMLSDYLDIHSEEEFVRAERKCDELLRLAHWLGTDRLRTFAGNKSSRTVAPGERDAYTERMRKLCRQCAAEGVQLVVETHPGTLADDLDSTLTLISDIGGDALRLNFDVLHVWEYGGDLMHMLHVLEPWIHHFHFKNIAHPSQVTLFEPGNVYSASGDRKGMVPLHQGFLDYRRLLEETAHLDCFASLEWFGPTPLSVLSEDIAWLHRQRYSLAGDWRNSI